MKVIVANYRYFVAGGPEKYMFKFIKASEKEGIEVIPFSVDNPQNIETPYKRYFAKPRSNQLLYKDTKLNLKNLYGMVRATVWNFDAYKKMRKLIKDIQPDIIYILHEINHLSPSIIKAAKKEKIPVVHRISDFFMICPKSDFLINNNICEKCIHGSYKYALKNKCIKNSLFATLLRVTAMKIYKITGIFKGVDKFVCTCEFTKNKLIEAGYEADKIECIPTFIESSNILPKYTNKKYFLILGRLAEQKGIIFAVEAMKYLKDYDCKLYITGELSNNNYDNRIKKIIKENNLEDKIIFTGFLHGKELEDIIGNSIAILSPAIWYENMPNSVIESFAYGKPVIASKIGSLCELVEDDKNGFLFEPKNAIDLSKKMKMYLYDDTLAEKHGRCAREYCEDKYGIDEHMTRLVALFNNEIKNKVRK